MKVKLYTEEDEQRQVVNWFKMQYPDAIINVDLGGIKLPMSLAVKVKRGGHYKSFPDLQICKNNGIYSGLFIEFKRTGTRVYKRDGKVRQNEHLIRQQNTLNILNKEGYKAVFSIGVDATIDLIKRYMRGEEIEQK